MCHFWVLGFHWCTSQKTLNISITCYGCICPYHHTFHLLIFCPAKHSLLHCHTVFGGQNKPGLFWRRLEQSHDLSPILGYNFTTGCCCCDVRSRGSAISWELDVNFLSNCLWQVTHDAGTGTADCWLWEDCDFSVFSLIYQFFLTVAILSMGYKRFCNNSSKYTFLSLK